MDSLNSNNLHGQQDERSTNPKRLNRDEPSCYVPPNHRGHGQKRAKTNSTQSGSALSARAVQEAVEAPGCSRSSNPKDKEGVRCSKEKQNQANKRTEVCEQMKAIMATKNLKFGEVVWAKADQRSAAWPAVIVDPVVEALEVVLNACARGTICVMYFSYAAGRIREYGWVKPMMIFRFMANKERFIRQKVGRLEDRFRDAVNEATCSQLVPNLYQPNLTAKLMHNVTAEAASSSSHKQRRPSKAQHDGQATMDPVDCVETLEGQVLHVGSPDTSGDSLPEELPVFCESFKGFYLPKEHLISCRCSSCRGEKMTPCTFEKHSGSRSKNWKRAVKIEQTAQSLENWIKSNNVRPQINQFNAKTTVGQKIDFLQVVSTPVIAKWTIERCSVCWDSGDLESDKMIICNRCQVAVHQNCYGAQNINDISSWVCRLCENPEVDNHCCLCPIKGGALIKTDVGGFWAHVTCAQFQPKVSISMEPSIGIRNLPLDAFGKTCDICQQTYGACTNCFTCSTYYHAMCALRAGYCMEPRSFWKDGNAIIQPWSYCSHHGFVDSGVGSVEIDLTEEGASPGHELPSNTEKFSTSCIETDLPSTSFEKYSCARCRIYEKGDKKRRQEAVAHLVMGPRHHSLEVIERVVGTSPPCKQDKDTFYKRVEGLKNKEKHNVCFGKSGIHGWGLFARRSIEEGELIIEYRGELIRHKVCNIREKHYREVGKDCYFFGVSDEAVIDATNKGNLARLINHSCQPNCFARKLAMGETIRLVFIAKENISAGQELTLDYKFDLATNEEDSVPCFCNAPNCRRHMA